MNVPGVEQRSPQAERCRHSTDPLAFVTARLVVRNFQICFAGRSYGRNFIPFIPPNLLPESVPLRGVKVSVNFIAKLSKLVHHQVNR